MVGAKTLSYLCVLGVVLLSTTATTTDVAQEKPKRESLDSGFFHKNDKPSTGLPKVEEPPMYSVEWYLLPEPENRAQLLEKLPFDVAKDVPKDCDEPIDAALEKRIRKFFSLRGLIFTSMSSYPPKVKEPGYTGSLEHMETSGPPKFTVEWYLLPKPVNRATLLVTLPFDLSLSVPYDSNEPIETEVEENIRKFFSLSEEEQVERRRRSHFFYS